MNYQNCIATALMVTSIAAIATPNKIAILQTVGPEPLELSKQPNDGILQVYSANEKALGYLIASDTAVKDEVSYESAHTDYAIYSDSGKLVKEVRNAQNVNDAIPSLVNLSAGQYKVVAKAQTGDGWTLTYNVPVVIKTGQKTVVHLEPDWRPSKQLEGKTALVLGHDGRIIGWQAEK